MLPLAWATTTPAALASSLLTTTDQWADRHSRDWARTLFAGDRVCSVLDEVAGDDSFRPENTGHLDLHQPAGLGDALLVLLEAKKALGCLSVAHHEPGRCLPEGGGPGNRRVDREQSFDDRVERGIGPELAADDPRSSSSSIVAAVVSNILSISCRRGGAFLIETSRTGVFGPSCPWSRDRLRRESMIVCSFKRNFRSLEWMKMSTAAVTFAGGFPLSFRLDLAVDAELFLAGLFRGDGRVASTGVDDVFDPGLVVDLDPGEAGLGTNITMLSPSIVSTY